MRKNIFFLLLLLSSLMSFAQQNVKEVTLKWDQQTLDQNVSDENFRLYFDDAKQLGITGIIPYYTLEIPVGYSKIISDIDLKPLTEESVKISANKYLDLQADISNTYSIKTIYKNRNGERIAIILFPAVKENTLSNVIDKLVSFRLSYQIIEDKNLPSKSSLPVFSSTSAMRDGEWYQFRISESGMYKLSYTQITEAGIDVSSIPSSNIKMYGFGGMIEEFNDDYRHKDIPEIAIKMVDGGDGIFNSGDYIVFYAQGPDTWKYKSSKGIFNHHTNIYSRYSYYYFVLSDEEGLRINETNSLVESDYTINSFADYSVIEDEKYNLINSGRRWFGDKFEFTTEYDYQFDFDNIKSNSDVHLKAVMAARSIVSSQFFVEIFGQSNRIFISSLSGGSYPAYAEGGQGIWTYTHSGSNSSIPIKVNYSQPLSGSVGWLDYLEINVIRDLIFTGNQMAFRSPESIALGRKSNFILQNPSNSSLEIWNISDITAPSKMNYNTNGSSINFKIATEELHEFIAFKESSLNGPEYVGEIENQNLHAELNHEYIIITHPDFIEQAEELAQFHRDYSNMDVYVTTLEPIYHEYSSGKQDVAAIRDFLRSVYENSDINNKLKYVLFFGDASMDYLNREDNNTNKVPTWESYESFDPISSIATDDFFGFLTEGEGKGNLANDDVDLGIGRFPVVTVQEAKEMVAKVKHYKSNHEEVMADWRNTICFIADDEDGNLHLDQANDLSILVDSIYPTANLDKIFVDAYQQESTPAGQRYPKANEAINERVEKGALIISYTGHGGEVGWGQERFLDVPDILSWNNTHAQPVFLTATCEFARYDDPDRVSAGELIFLNSQGGGISLFTTARATYAGSNFTVSKNFYKIALKKQNGKYLRMGDILKETKIASGSGVNVQKFILLGDPALTINMPEHKINITAIENNSAGQRTDTIKALSYITIRGNITNSAGSLLTDFNGFVYPAIFDKPSEITTLGNDAGSSAYTFYLQKNILYKGKADVTNGEFEFSFIAPKDISYKYGKGKISLYAENLDTDASGYNRDIIIGGFDNTNISDEDGPNISLYMNNTNFQSGGITDENPVLLAYIFDENGINTTGNGIGHDISAKLDNNENNVKVLNDYYVSDANSYKSGVISFPYFNLSDGTHTIEFKVWDIYNNSNKASISFVVASSAELALNDIFNYPNPVFDNTTFSFQHNQADEELDITIDIYSINGQHVTQLKESLIANSYRNNSITWDATDSFGNRIMKGIYVYKVSVKTSSGKESQETSKLVIIK